MKKVLTPEKVAQAWATKSQSEARNASGNFYFDGDTIYSYGSHFPIARHVTNDLGEGAILITTKGYSVTTARQIGRVRLAASRTVLPIFHVPCVTRRDGFEPFDAFKTYAPRIEELQGKVARARSYKELHNEQLEALRKEAAVFAQFFGIAQAVAA